MNKTLTFSSILFIAKKYSAKRGERFSNLISQLAKIGIFLGVMALVIVISVMNGLENQQKQRVFKNEIEAIVMPKKGNLDRINPFKTPDFVRYSTPISKSEIIIQSENSVLVGSMIGVLDAKDDSRLHHIPVSEMLPKRDFKIIISSYLASQINVGIGDKVRISLIEKTRFTPFGRVPISRLFTVAGFTEDYSENVTIFTHLDDLNALLGIKSNQAQGLRLFLKDPYQVSKLGAFYNEKDYNISDWRAVKGELFQAIKMEKNIIGLLISLIILVAISNILTSLSLMVIDKKTEIAILQTIGLKRIEILLVFLFQGLRVGLWGTILGILLGSIIAYFVTDIMLALNFSIVLPSQINPIQILVITMFSVLCSLLSALYPALNATKITPASTLRGE